MNTQRPATKITRQTGSGKHPEPDLSAPDVLRQALAALERYLRLPQSPEADYGPAEIFSVLLYAGAHRTTVEQGCAALEAAPHPNTVRNAAAAVEVAELEEQLNQALAQSLPKRWGKQPLEVAVDLKLIPYYGDPHEGEEEFIVNGQPRQGTTTFFGYASLYVIKRDRRYTLAVVAVRRGEGMRGVLRRLWRYWRKLGLRLRCLYLDREFYSVAVLRWLLGQELPFVMAAPRKGKRGGINGLIQRQGPGVWPYTLRSPKDGSVTVQVAVVGKYLNGRRGKHGRKCYAFLIHRFPFATSALWKKYRTRFGIESAHRVWEQARARTASRRAGLRLLLLGIAVLLHNLWVWLKWTALSWPRRGPGGRQVWNKGLPFRRLLLFLARAIERRLGAVTALFLPVSPA